jgi:hypothetical protein
MRELTMNEFGFVSGGNVAPPPSPPPSNQTTGSRAGGFQVAHDFRADQTIYACQAPSDSAISGLFDGTNLGSVTNPSGQGLPGDPSAPSNNSTFNTTGTSNPVVLFFSLLFHARPAN